MNVTVVASEDADICRLAVETEVGRLEGALGAREIDALIVALAARRAAMHPVHPARFDADEALVHEGDNLLWDTFADAPHKAVIAAFQSPGIGWLTLRLSRAQVEDLITSLEFSAQALRLTLEKEAEDIAPLQKTEP